MFQSPFSGSVFSKSPAEVFQKTTNRTANQTRLTKARLLVWRSKDSAFGHLSLMLDDQHIAPIPEHSDYQGGNYLSYYADDSMRNAGWSSFLQGNHPAYCIASYEQDKALWGGEPAEIYEINIPNAEENNGAPMNRLAAGIRRTVASTFSGSSRYSLFGDASNSTEMNCVVAVMSTIECATGLSTPKEYHNWTIFGGQKTRSNITPDSAVQSFNEQGYLTKIK